MNNLIKSGISPIFFGPIRIDTTHLALCFPAGLLARMNLIIY
jgi:hypothetical protein